PCCSPIEVPLLVAAAARAAATATAAAAEARLLGPTVHREGGELPGDIRRGAVGARHLLGTAHELLEVGLALHADVFVDRHAPKSTRSTLRQLADCRGVGGRAAEPVPRCDRDPEDLANVARRDGEASAH